MSARHYTLWADPRLADAYDLVSDVVRDHSIAEDKIPEVAALLTEINKADEFLAGLLRDRRAS
ncbi:hypothetical protein SLG_21760 [Sphingobium sp. SYK-6]|uniref:hypothetical protein n=1 Tax=Sphingobium sp. (strain NBRC 103272 / SYK-6) TaxID=627192 RepID=UPI00022770AB|nr:hypothetical protein [Sphingobium sp. SYK-6]BAK66851.1 hypothetical protein SLG_21760 [Sphingobium sp. SYK-6]